MKHIKQLVIFLLLIFTAGCTQTSVPEPVQTDTSVYESQVPENETLPLWKTKPFIVYFLDVGQAESTLIICDGEIMLIDGGGVKNGSYIVAYLKNLGIEHIDYMICTHAHEDHAGGLSGPLNTCTVSKVYAPVTEYDTKAFSDFIKYVSKQGLEITLPIPGETFNLGSASVHILGPLYSYDEPNNTSIVTQISYGDTVFLFTGDMEREAELDLIDAGYELGADVLQVGHHGSNTSTSYPFLREVMPEYAVISAGKDNEYGHPAEDTLSRLRDAEVTVYRTDLQGVITVISDGEKLEFITEKNEAPLPGRSGEETVYICIGNIKSKIFHRENCQTLPAELNQIIFENRDKALETGFRACYNCKP